MDVDLCSSNEETIFDLFLRKKLEINTFNWEKIDLNKAQLSGEVAIEGILIENEITNNSIIQGQPKLYRLIDNQLIRFHVK